MNDVNNINIVYCECGVEFEQASMKQHELSIEHQKYFTLKKAFQEALSKPVQSGVAS